jgi:hypothetical protein
MENSKKVQFGLLAVVAALLVANLFGGGFKTWFGNTNSVKEAASLATSASGMVSPVSGATDNGTGNIPGTNTTENAVPTGPTTTIKYEQESFDFGVVNEGEVVTHVFKFKNTGTEPLTVTNAKASCGCTVPNWSKEPVAPGASGEIKVEFNSKGKPGNQSKRVTVTANTNPTDTFIEIKGMVKGKDVPAPAAKTPAATEKH